MAEGRVAEGAAGGEAGQAGVVLRTRRKAPAAGANNGLLRLNRPKSEYISPSGVSTLDIRTRLRITEAELAIVQREVSDLLTERSSLEASARQYQESWKFAVQECGRIVEQRDELQKKLEALEQAIAAAYHQSPEAQKGRKSKQNLRAELDQCRLALETQTNVCLTLEHERDRANDDYEFAQAQVHTMMTQYQELATACAEVARQREKARAEVQLLREELHRYDPEADAGTKKSSESIQSGGEVEERGGEAGPVSEQFLRQTISDIRSDKDKLRALYDQAMGRAEQYQKQLYRAEEDRRQALATSEALTALWQKKFEKAQNESYDLKQEILSAQDRISHLHECLARARLMQTHGATPNPPSSQATPPDDLPTPTSFGRHGPPHRASSFHSLTQQSTAYPGPGYSLSPAPSLTQPAFPLHSNTHSSNSTSALASLSVNRQPSGLKTQLPLISPSNSTAFHTHSSSRRRPAYEEPMNSGDLEEASWI